MDPKDTRLIKEVSTIKEIEALIDKYGAENIEVEGGQQWRVLCGPRPDAVREPKRVRMFVAGRDENGDPLLDWDGETWIPHGTGQIAAYEDMSLAHHKFGTAQAMLTVRTVVALHPDETENKSCT